MIKCHFEVSKTLLGAILPLLGLLFLLLCCVEALGVCQVVNSDGQEDI